MTQRRVVIVGAVAMVVVGGALVGFVIARLTAEPTPTASPSPSTELACRVSVSPATILVDPDTGASDDVVFFAGSGFLPESAVQISFNPAASVSDYTTTAAGTFTAEVHAAPEMTYPSPPNIEPGPVAWTISGYDVPDPPYTYSPIPDPVCLVHATVTIEFTHTPSPTPPTDLSAGGYAEVIADGVRVRIAPSSTATVIGALFSADVVRILAPAQVAEGIAWYRVETVVVQSGEPMTGYVAAGVEGQPFLRPTTEPPPPTPSPSVTPSPTP